MKTLILMISLTLTTLFGYGQGCYYTLTLEDTYGDGWYDYWGWNNGVIDIKINNTLIYDDLFITTDLETLQIVVGDGNTLTISYESLGGSEWYWYENENTWSITDCHGVTTQLGVGDGNNQSVDITVDCDCEPTDGDCGTAETICGAEVIEGNTTGPGVFSELNVSNHGCLLGNEHYSNWIYFHAETDGTIELTITPNNENGGDDDYDFAIWESGVCPPTTQPIRCSWAAMGGNTGLISGVGDNSEDDFGDGWVESIDVLAGNEFAMIIDNYSSNNNSFTLTWSLADGATLDCSTMPVEFLSSNYSCQSNTLSWEIATETNNDYFTILVGNYLTEGMFVVENEYILNGVDNSNTVTNYSQPFNQVVNGKYIKVSQTDFDGTTTEMFQTYISCGGNESEILVVPNPTTEEVGFTVIGDYNTIKVYDITGRELDIQLIDDRVIGLNSGVFIVVIDNKSKTKLIIK